MFGRKDNKSAGKSDRTTCNARADHNILNEFANTNDKVERNIMQKTINIGTVQLILMETLSTFCRQIFLIIPTFLFIYYY